MDLPGKQRKEKHGLVVLCIVLLFFLRKESAVGPKLTVSFLQDKWKTLVHTARISPQQRRGEPVPQELLDRVLNAHAYWSQQQAKQQLKHQQHPETCHDLL